MRPHGAQALTWRARVLALCRGKDRPVKPTAPEPPPAPADPTVWGRSGCALEQLQPLPPPSPTPPPYMGGDKHPCPTYYRW